MPTRRSTRRSAGARDRRARPADRPRHRASFGRQAACPSSASSQTRPPPRSVQRARTERCRRSPRAARPRGCRSRSRRRPTSSPTGRRHSSRRRSGPSHRYVPSRSQVGGGTARTAAFTARRRVGNRMSRHEVVGVRTALQRGNTRGWPSIAPGSGFPGRSTPRPPISNAHPDRIRP